MYNYQELADNYLKSTKLEEVLTDLPLISYQMTNEEFNKLDSLLKLAIKKLALETSDISELEIMSKADHAEWDLISNILKNPHITKEILLDIADNIQDFFHHIDEKELHYAVIVSAINAGFILDIWENIWDSQMFLSYSFEKTLSVFSCSQDRIDDNLFATLFDSLKKYCEDDSEEDYFLFYDLSCCNLTSQQIAKLKSDVIIAEKIQEKEKEVKLSFLEFAASESDLDQFLASANFEVFDDFTLAALHNSNLPNKYIELAVKSNQPDYNLAVAMNCNLTKAQFKYLSSLKDSYVQMDLKKNPAYPW